jgi:hypothetical protein
MSARNKQHPITSLPFVFDHAPTSRRNSKRSFWHVTPSGDYGEDCRTGSRYAVEYLRVVAEEDKAVYRSGGWLALIVGAMRKALADGERSGIEGDFSKPSGSPRNSDGGRPSSCTWTPNFIGEWRAKGRSSTSGPMAPW